jgi:tRNA modification GTPase
MKLKMRRQYSHSKGLVKGGQSALFSSAMASEETIVAISTPPGNGAIGIIRLSGPDAFSILAKVWEGKVPVQEFESRRIYTGHINGLRGGTLDQVLVFLMKAPSSYTGEDLIEIQGHGGQRLMELLLENLVAAGARPAEPGEFTKRAFLNGRIDLAQAEAVADLISASSAKAAELAGRQLEGRLSKFVGKLRNELKVMRAQMEAMIDFPEDGDIQDLKINIHEEIQERTGAIAGQIRDLVETYEEGRSFREGVHVAIVGKPNAGKSSLFNALLKEDRAIVHPTPGTTRDLIEEILDLNGLPVRFIDTAGIRQGEESIESEGIRRTRERLKQADLVLAVIDSSRPLDEQDAMVFEAVQGKEVFYLYNKIDLPPFFSEEVLKKKFGVSVFPISAKEGAGIGELKKGIYSHFIKRSAEDKGSDLVLTNLRHRIALQKGLDALAKIREGCDERRSLEFLAADLSIAMNFLGEVTGEVTNDEILGEIFSKFCIGK